MGEYMGRPKGSKNKTSKTEKKVNKSSIDKFFLSDKEEIQEEKHHKERKQRKKKEHIDKEHDNILFSNSHLKIYTYVRSDIRYIVFETSKMSLEIVYMTDDKEYTHRCFLDAKAAMSFYQHTKEENDAMKDAINKCKV